MFRRYIIGQVKLVSRKRGPRSLPGMNQNRLVACLSYHPLLVLEPGGREGGRRRRRQPGLPGLVWVAAWRLVSCPGQTGDSLQQPAAARRAA